jgi:nucleoside-diphosphate-sugar epimerase
VLEHQNQDPTNPTRVVVIGASGVIGKAVRSSLTQAGVPMLALGSRELDLLDADATEKLAAQIRPHDVLLMLSALTPDRGRDTATFMKNLHMAEAVSNTISRTSVAQVVYLSSDAVYPFTAGVTTEDSPAAPSDLYGVMHRSRELIFAQAAGAVPLAVLRCTLVAATDDTHNSYGPNRFRREARDKQTITLGGEGEETRDHILVEDVAALILRTIQHRSRGVLNLATGQSRSFRAVADMVAEDIVPTPKVVTTARTSPVTHRHFDVTAIRLAFPDFRFTDLRTGLARIHGGEKA